MTTSTETTTPTTGERGEASADGIVYLDPRQLIAHPSNVRKNVGDLKGLIRSIKGLGLLVPLVVLSTEDGRHQVVAGHRRCAAAVEAGLEQVPCLVRDDLDDARQVAAMLVENTQRVGLSAAEEAAGYEQLAILGMSEFGIARATGATKRHIQKARQVAASAVASAVADRYELTLDQAVVLSEFDEDEAAVKQLTVTAKQDPGQFDHVASRLRQDRQRKAECERAVEELRTQGITAMTGGEADALTGAASLRDLVDAEGNQLTSDNHGDCPGHAAVVTDWDPQNPHYICVAPAKHGHRSRYGRSSRPGSKPMSEEEKAERRVVIENNKAWRAAEPVRRKFVRELLTRKKPPPGTLRYAVNEVFGDPESVGKAKDETLGELLGVESSGGYSPHVGVGFATRASDTRLPLVLLAQVGADVEQMMAVQTWRNGDDRAARWFKFLSSVGYELSDIENLVVEMVEPAEDQPAPSTDADPAMEQVSTE